MQNDHDVDRNGIVPAYFGFWICDFGFNAFCCLMIDYQMTGKMR
jgi:hypothetical protein